jgi:ABC-2 type transport system ATP-binding protein
MTAEQNLKLVCKIKKHQLSKFRKKLELVGLNERRNSKFSTFFRDETTSGHCLPY